MRKLPDHFKDWELLIRRLIIFTLILGAVVLYFPEIFQILATLTWICLPFIIGTIIAFILNTLTHVIIRFCSRIIKIRLSRKTEIYFKLLTVFIVVIIVAFSFASIVPQLLNSLEGLITNIPYYVADVYERIINAAQKYPALVDWLVNNEQTFLNASTFIPSLLSFITTGGIGSTLGEIGNALSGTFGWLWIVFISVMFSFIAFFNTSRFVSEGKLIAKAYLSVRQYRFFTYVMSKMYRIFSQYLGGTLLECVILGTLVSLLNIFLNIPYPLLIGVTCGIFALIPMFGATFAALICAALVAVTNPLKGGTFLIGFILLQQVEGNFIYPNVVGKSVGLPSIYVLIAITLGASAAGILGIILSIPVTTLIYELITEDARRRVLKKEEKEKDKACPE